MTAMKWTDFIMGRKLLIKIYERKEKTGYGGKGLTVKLWVDMGIYTYWVRCEKEDQMSRCKLWQKYHYGRKPILKKIIIKDVKASYVVYSYLTHFWKIYSQNKFKKINPFLEIRVYMRNYVVHCYIFFNNDPITILN